MTVVVLNGEFVISLVFGANMGEIIRFITKSEHERVRLIREARAIYNSIFPPAIWIWSSKTRRR